MPMKKSSARKTAKRTTSRTAARKTAKTSPKSGGKARKTTARKSSAGSVKLVHSRSKPSRQSYSQM